MDESSRRKVPTYLNPSKAGETEENILEHIFCKSTVPDPDSTKLKIVFDTLIYNGIATTTPKTTLEHEWEMKKDGILKELHQDARIKNIRRVSADFKANKNETKVTDRVKEEGEKSVTKIIKSGIVPLTFSTRGGESTITY